MGGLQGEISSVDAIPASIKRNAIVPSGSDAVARRLDLFQQTTEECSMLSWLEKVDIVFMGCRGRRLCCVQGEQEALS